MAFWGAEILPGKSHVVRCDDAGGRLCISQATLGDGKGTEKSIVMCSVGRRNPVFICALTPKVLETCNLHLEFDEDDDVIFTVRGQRSVHMCGYYIDSSWSEDENDSDDSYGEDIEMEDSEALDSSEEHGEDVYDSDFDDDDEVVAFARSPQRRSGVIIEEIIEDDKPSSENVENRGSSEGRLAIEPSSVELASEDEDGFPISASRGDIRQENTEICGDTIDKTNDERGKHKAEIISNEDNAGRSAGTKVLKRKRNIKCDGADDNSGRNEEIKVRTKDLNKKKKTKKGKSSSAPTEVEVEEGNIAEENQLGSANLNNNCKGEELPVQSDANSDRAIAKRHSEEEVKRQKKKKTKKNEEAKNHPAGEDAIPVDDQKTQKRTFGNGMIVEELQMGKPDGKKASAGKKVFVKYIGKLKNGKIFDSNVGRQPFKFRLGVGEVIKGWDVGVQGMRVGDKRRLTIPPSMGYGDKAAGPIPKNSWLFFDVELVDVK